MLEETPPTRESKVVKPGAKQKARPVASPLNAPEPVTHEEPEPVHIAEGTPKKDLGSAFAAAVDVRASASPVKSPDAKKTKTAAESSQGSMLCEAPLLQWPSGEPFKDSTGQPQTATPKEPQQDSSLDPGRQNPKQQQCAQKADSKEPQTASLDPGRQSPKQQQCPQKADSKEPQNASLDPGRQNPKQQQCQQKADSKEPQNASLDPGRQNPKQQQCQQKADSKEPQEPQKNLEVPSARITSLESQGSQEHEATQVQESPSERSSQCAVSWLAC